MNIMTEEEKRKIDMVQKMFGGSVSIGQFVNGNGIYIEKVENNYRNQPDSSKQDGGQQESSAKAAGGNHASGRRQESLFVAADGTGDECLAREKAKEFKSFLVSRGLDTEQLSSRKDSSINRAFLAFFKRWQGEGLIPKNFTGSRAAFRFLHEDCGIESEVAMESFANVMIKWMRDFPDNDSMEKLVSGFYEESA